ncbi:hypothetical protein Thiowin_03774 [Thiorhodovibrio winogradskyi]|uniref:Uncharacterized protein n=1 Tax=Thiorhodovibrio winogradskyi TaxID=77007 RepID=A0ABZ0SF00_9GAMM
MLAVVGTSSIGGKTRDDECRRMTLSQHIHTDSHSELFQ